MRILIISTYFPPLNSIGSLRAHSWAKYWTLFGHEVTVLTTKKVHDESTAFNLENSGYSTIEVPMPSFFNKAKSSYLNPEQKTHVRERTFSLKQALISIFHYLQREKGVFHQCRMPDFTDLWARSAFRTIKDRGPWDLVVSSAWPYTTHQVAFKLKKEGLAKKWCADYRDLWTDNYHYPGIFPFTFLEKVLERKYVGKADAVTTVSKPLADHFRQNFHKKQVYVIENGFDPSDLCNIDSRLSFPSDGKYRIVYTGSIYPKTQDPTPLLIAIQKLSLEKDFSTLLDRLEVLFVSSQHILLNRLIKEYNVSRWVKCKNQIPREEALRLQRDANALLFLPYNVLTKDGCLTGKVFEYLFSGTPVICVGAKGLEAAQRLIEEVNGGTIFHSTEEIQQFLTSKLLNIQKEEIIPPKWFIEKYTREALARKMLSIFE